MADGLFDEAVARFGRGPAWASDPSPDGVRVARFEPEGQGAEGHDDMQIFVTHGMSARAMTLPDEADGQVPDRVELVIAAPPTWSADHATTEAGFVAVRVLLATASYPFLHGTYIGNLHTLPAVDAFGARQLAGWLVTMDFVTELGKGDESVQYLLMTPLLPAEFAYARDQGSKALLGRLFEMAEALGADWGHFLLPSRIDATRFAAAPGGGGGMLVPDMSQIVAKVAREHGLPEPGGPELAANLQAITANMLSEHLGGQMADLLSQFQEQPAGWPEVDREAPVIEGVLETTFDGEYLRVQVPADRIDAIVALASEGQPFQLVGAGRRVFVGVEPSGRVRRLPESTPGNEAWQVSVGAPMSRAAKQIPAGRGLADLGALELWPPIPDSELEQLRQLAFFMLSHVDEAPRGVRGTQPTPQQIARGNRFLSAAQRLLHRIGPEFDSLEPDTRLEIVEARVFDEPLNKAAVVLMAGTGGRGPSDPEQRAVLLRVAQKYGMSDVLAKLGRRPGASSLVINLVAAVVALALTALAVYVAANFLVPFLPTP